MILISTKNEALQGALTGAFSALSVETVTCDPSSSDLVTHIYGERIKAAIVDNEVPLFPAVAWLDMIGNLGRRIPILVLGKKGSTNKDSTGKFLDTVIWLQDPDSSEVVHLLDSFGVLGLSKRKVDRVDIPLFNAQVPLMMLQKDNALSVLTIDTGSFRDIALEYGREVYYRLQDCFRQILYSLWGTAGSFRATDLLCRKSMTGNTYYIILEKPRISGSVPAPGVLERISDRIVVKLLNALWNELLSSKKQRILPECITVVPEISIGHATVINNPCFDSLELLEQLIDNSNTAARIQMGRVRDRQKELLQSLIQADDLLWPHYQAVFRLPDITEEMVRDAKLMKSIKPFRDQLFGFESLIRVKQDRVEALMDRDAMGYIEARHLVPNVLFALAHTSKIALELDQTCLRHATAHAQKLPGVLMVNILPRNLYFIDRLQEIFQRQHNLIFEVSESEAISNFDLMIKVRDKLQKMNIGIATDDFGKGYAGLERVIKTKPDIVKLDRALIENIHQEKHKQIFLKGVIEMAKISVTTILAEGVESWEEARILKEMGVDLVQGYLFHRPQEVQKIHEDLGEGEVKEIDIKQIAA